MTKTFSNFVRPGLMAAALLCAAAVAAPATAQTAPITGVPAMKDFPGANELPDPKPGLQDRVRHEHHAGSPTTRCSPA